MVPWAWCVTPDCVKVTQVRAGPDVFLASQLAGINVGHGAFPQAVAQNRLACRLIRRQDEKHPIEPARAPKRHIHVPGVVGRTQDEDSLVVAVQSVHLRQPLVDKCLAPRCCAVALLTSLLPERVDLVQEDHAGRAAARNVEQLPHVALTLADVHVEDVSQRHGQKTGSHHPRHSPGDECLATPREAVQPQASSQ